MNTDDDDRRLDERDRITIPKHIRNRSNLETGQRVRVTVENGSVVVRPRISRQEFVRSMRGSITEAAKVADASTDAPEGLKADWTSDLPDD
ncbi:AbrB/MazE/SpoVT family DNA-binding domain-containing protein [Natrinema caseinilyticum]|uniref:AbrB/MazE/SpoVT family DNA-binding domain-containing protein n=1 Tax=Natrinema caseinilyticum TaxID=2961570 RepID=UPI0020C2A9CC|nr:AbrB/MazE/SpoVT family DNA-binding domain-containing protein [Natrinema caseinilyticum]